MVALPHLRNDPPERVSPPVAIRFVDSGDYQEDDAMARGRPCAVLPLFFEHTNHPQNTLFTIAQVFFEISEGGTQR